MPFPAEIREKALVACGRHCCICHRFAGTKIECHHIVPESNGRDDTLGNCIPLCFDCHADVQHYNSKHPKGTKYGESELRLHRENWYSRISSTTPVIFDQERREIDRKIFKEFREFLPEEEAEEILHKQCWGESFSRDWLHKLRDINIYISRLDSQFLDPTCEGLRAQFVNAYQAFLHSSSFIQISPVEGTLDRYRIPKEWDMSNDPFLRQQFEDVKNLLNQLSEEAYKAYVSFVFEVRKLLICK